MIKRGGTSDPSSVSLMKDWRSANKLYLLLQKPFSIPRSLYQVSFLSPISFNFKLWEFGIYMKQFPQVDPFLSSWVCTDTVWRNFTLITPWSCHRRGTWEKSWVPMRNPFHTPKPYHWTSDSMVSEAHCDSRIPHTSGISNVDTAMFCR